MSDEFGLVNCWQAANPDQPLCQTLRWTRDRTTPYHWDTDITAGNTSLRFHCAACNVIWETHLIAGPD